MDDITKHTPVPPEENPKVSHERTDVDVFSVTKFGIGLGIGTIVAVFLMWGLFDWFYHREDMKNPVVAPDMTSQRPTAPPEPRLQVTPRLDLAALRQSEEAALTSYAWIDRAKGKVRIPIAAAMDLTAEKGLPVRLSSAGQENDGYRTLPTKASSGRALERISQ